MSWPVIGVGVVVSIVVVVGGWATGTAVYVVIGLVVAVIVVTLPFWIGEIASYTFGLLMLGLIVSGVAWLAINVPLWAWIAVPVLLVPVFVWALRRPWTIEAISWMPPPQPEFKGMWWKVPGHKQSSAALNEVADALRRGTAETLRPVDASGGPKVVSVLGVTRPPVE